jgi:hypothetical protein
MERAPRTRVAALAHPVAVAPPAEPAGRAGRVKRQRLPPLDPARVRPRKAARALEWEVRAGCHPGRLDPARRSHVAQRVAPDGHQLQRNFVSLIDTATEKVAAKIPTGKNAFKQIS